MIHLETAFERLRSVSEKARWLYPEELRPAMERVAFAQGRLTYVRDHPDVYQTGEPPPGEGSLSFEDQLRRDGYEARIR